MKILNGAITEEAWAHFQTYAVRVRHLWQSEALPSLHPSVWSLLWIRCIKSPFLPCLQSINASDIYPAQVSSLLLFVSPSVRDFTVELYDDDVTDPVNSDVANCFLHTLSVVSPHLRRLDISGDNPMTKDTLSRISSFSRLQDISLGPEYPVDEGLVRTLSGIHSLKAISFCILFQGSTNLGIQGAFREVSRARLSGTAEDLISLFRSTSMCNLTDLEITVEGDLGQKATSSLAALFQYIPKLIRRLKSVFHGVIGQPAISFAAFIRSFLSLQVIATIDISFYHYIPSISDADLSLIAESWPQLEQLKIHPFRDHVRSTLLRPTASGIIDLARRCPQLKSLYLPELDARILPYTSDIPLLGHALKELSFQTVLLPPKRVDAALSTLAAAFDLPFPNLDTLRSTRPAIPDSNPPTTRTGWARICACIRTMQLGREHQRLYDDSARRALVSDRSTVVT